MPAADLEQLRRWRLILGKDAQQPIDGMGGCALSAPLTEAEEKKLGELSEFDFDDL